MSILKSNLINGEKPKFGNVDHILFCQQIEGIRNGTRPIIGDSDFEQFCDKNKSFIDCINARCNCSKSKATFICINCETKHTVISGYAVINSPIICKCGFTYSELYGGYMNDWFLISDGTEDTIY